MSDEDELVQDLLGYYSDDECITTTVEEHYNYYGDRGVVDTVVEHPGRITLIEVKSESAIREATGANEIIRQCKRHAEYYFQDKPTRKSRDLWLTFYATPQTWKHFTDNIGMYRSFYENDVNGCSIDVSFQHPEMTGSLKPLHPVIGYDKGDFERQIGEHNKEIAEFVGWSDE